MPADGPPYLTSARFRRASLETALVSHSNDYAQARLAHYGTGNASGWDGLPEWNPEVVLVEPSALRGVPLTRSARDLAISADASQGLPEALRVLGEEAFFRYPVQLVPAARVALASTQSATRYGLWQDAEHGVGGLVRVELGAGQRAFAVTCATCHVRQDNGGTLVVGAGNEQLDLGGMLEDGRSSDAQSVPQRLLWGRGRIDVTTMAGSEPVRISDLRPVRFQAHLHHDATLVLRDVTTLAIRLETLIIASNGGTIRPPRTIALALAQYVWSLGDALPPRDARTESELRGRKIFAEHCARCHVPPSFAGPPVALAEIGTDATLGRSRDRGTGAYRTPSLRGVSARGPLLHDATAPSLQVLFDPARARPGYAHAAHGVSIIPGHLFGLELDEASRSALVAYVETL